MNYIFPKSAESVADLQCGRFVVDLRIVFPKSAGLVWRVGGLVVADLRIAIHESAGVNS